MIFLGQYPIILAMVYKVFRGSYSLPFDGSGLADGRAPFALPLG